MRTEKILLYPERHDVSLTTYLIAQEGELKTVGKRPAVLICPGGGYLGCSDREAEPAALAFNAMGYHSFVLRYSTWMEGKEEFPDLKRFRVKPHLVHPAPVLEIGMAMKYIYDHGPDWLIDTEKIALCGFSAGGHNAAMYGVYWNKPLITDSIPIESWIIRPAALILSYALTDYVHFFMHMDEMSESNRTYFEMSIKAFLGENVDEEMLYSVSLARLVDDHVPPNIFVGHLK